MCKRTMLHLLLVGFVAATAARCEYVQHSFVGGIREGTVCVVEDITGVLRVDISLSWGTDLGFHVMATKYMRLASYSYEDLYRVGMTVRTLGLWEEQREGDWIGPWVVKWGGKAQNTQHMESI